MLHEHTQNSLYWNTADADLQSDRIPALMSTTELDSTSR